MTPRVVVAAIHQGDNLRAYSGTMAAMKRPRSFFLLLLFVSCASSPQSLDQRIAAIEKTVPTATIAVSFYDLQSGRTWEHNEQVSMHAASTMKVPVMLALFDSIDRGILSLDQSIPVRNEFISIFDGSKFAVDPKEDSDQELYAKVGQSVTLEELIRRMITRSSNLATDIVIELVGAPKVMDLMQRIGAGDIRILRGVEDIAAYEHEMNNVTTAHDLMLVMRTIAEKKAISHSASEAMLEILKGQEFNSGIPAGLPRGTTVAHKTGSITSISHDAAIVYPSGGTPYVLVVMTRNIPKGTDASKVIARISRAVWERRQSI
ncbi:MAG: serine hydrolase [Acidobacteriota bacterium]